MAVARDEIGPDRKEAERLLLRGGAAEADRVMDGGDAARPEVRGLLFAQRLGVIFRAEVDLDRREHINHDRALHQLYRPLRIDAVRRRIDLEMRARDIGGRQGGGDGRARTASRLPSGKKDRKSTRLN